MHPCACCVCCCLRCHVVTLRSVGGLPMASDRKTRRCLHSVGVGPSMTFSGSCTCSFGVLMFDLVSSSSTPSPPLRCVCCSEDSAESASTKKKYVAPPAIAEPMLLCHSCGSSQLFRHAVEFKDSIASSSKTAPANDGWCCAVSQLERSGDLVDDFVISSYISCEFSAGLPKLRPSFCLPVGVYTTDTNSSSGAAASPSSHGKRKRGLALTRTTSRIYSPQARVNSSFLSGYFSSSKPFTIRRPKPRAIANNEGVNTDKNRASTCMNNPAAGALDLPICKVLIKTQGCNYRPGSDHHHLAEDSESPPAMHGVLSQSASENLMKHMSGTPFCHFKPREFTVSDVVVQAPEDPDLSRAFKVAIINLRQVKRASDVTCLRGHTVSSVSGLAGRQLFRDVSVPNVDATLMLGNFELEDQPCSPKVLCLRFHALQSALSCENATHLFRDLSTMSGKHGFEFARVCGSSGMTCAQADRDFLRALHEVETSLPWKVGATKITCYHPFKYKVTYRTLSPPPFD